MYAKIFTKKSTVHDTTLAVFFAFISPLAASGHPGCPPGVDPSVYSWFVAVDADNSGAISAKELQQALTNGNWSHFNAETCRLMIGRKSPILVCV